MRRSLFLLLVLIAPWMTIACDDDNGDPADTTNPEITILDPEAAGSVPAAAVLIRARATDNRGIESVGFFVDGVEIGEDATGTDNVYEFTWDASGLNIGGAHTIRVHAVDTSGNDDEATITVTTAAVMAKARQTRRTVDPRILVCRGLNLIIEVPSLLSQRQTKRSPRVTCP